MKSALFILLPVWVVLGCTAAGRSDHQLGVTTFQEKLALTPEATVLDVRTEAEYREGHLPNATLMDVRRSDFSDHVLELERSKPLFVYCASGIRSDKAVNILRQLGFREVYELKGGFHEWVGAGKPYLKSH